MFVDDKLIGNFMKKLFACLLMLGTAGLASAQVSNFTGFSGAVNLSAASTNTKIGQDLQGIGGDNVIASLQGAYGLELSSSSVLGLGLTYAAGKSKSGSFLGDDGDTLSFSVKNQYSLFIEPGTLLSDNTLFYGKISIEKGKFAVSSPIAANSASKSISGTGYGVGMRHMLDKTKFLQVELMKVGYKSFRLPGDTTDIKSSTTLGTIGIGMKF
jgi:hypothetical protein